MLTSIQSFEDLCHIIEQESSNKKLFSSLQTNSTTFASTQSPVSFHTISITHLSLLCDRSLRNGDKWMIFVSSHLRLLSRLEYLDLSGCGLGCEHLVILVQTLQSSGIGLKSLLLNGNKIGDHGSKSLAQYVLFSTGMRMLHLRFNNIGDDGLHAIAKTISFHKCLTSLNVSFNQFSTSGVKSLCYSLLLNRSLEELIIAGNALYDNHSALSDFINHSTVLRILDLSSCMLGNRASNLKIESQSLETLNLSGNKFRDKDVATLLSHLSSCKSLTSLDLSQNAVCEVGGISVATYVSKHEQLRHLNMSDNNLTFLSCLPLIVSIEEHLSLIMINYMRNDLSHHDCQQLFDRIEKSIKRRKEHNQSKLHPPCIVFSPKISSENIELTTIVYRLPLEFPSPESVEEDMMLHIFTKHQNNKMRKQSVQYYYSDLDLNIKGQEEVATPSHFYTNETIDSLLDPRTQFLRERESTEHSSEVGFQNDLRFGSVIKTWSDRRKERIHKESYPQAQDSSRMFTKRKENDGRKLLPTPKFLDFDQVEDAKRENESASFFNSFRTQSK